jgi:hypothetical protein
MNKLIEAEKTKLEKPFPKLMKNKAHNYYVYFIEKRKGVVLYSTYPIYEEGYAIHTNDNAWVMDHFEDTDDQIIVNT